MTCLAEHPWTYLAEHPMTYLAEQPMTCLAEHSMTCLAVHPMTCFAEHPILKSLESWSGKWLLKINEAKTTYTSFTLSTVRQENSSLTAKD
jgi:hypothetical protein